MPSVPRPGDVGMGAHIALGAALPSVSWEPEGFAKSLPRKAPVSANLRGNHTGGTLEVEVPLAPGRSKELGSMGHERRFPARTFSGQTGRIQRRQNSANSSPFPELLKRGTG